MSTNSDWLDKQCFVDPSLVVLDENIGESWLSVVVVVDLSGDLRAPLDDCSLSANELLSSGIDESFSLRSSTTISLLKVISSPSCFPAPPATLPLIERFFLPQASTESLPMPQFTCWYVHQEL